MRPHFWAHDSELAAHARKATFWAGVGSGFPSTTHSTGRKPTRRNQGITRLPACHMRSRMEPSSQQHLRSQAGGVVSSLHTVIDIKNESRRKKKRSSRKHGKLDMSLVSAWPKIRKTRPRGRSFARPISAAEAQETPLLSRDEQRDQTCIAPLWRQMMDGLLGRPTVGIGSFPLHKGL